MMTDKLQDGMYIINGKRQLYYQDGFWFKPIYSKGRYTGSIMPLEKQPVRIKTVDKINTTL